MEEEASIGTRDIFCSVVLTQLIYYIKVNSVVDGNTPELPQGNSTSCGMTRTLEPIVRLGNGVWVQRYNMALLYLLFATAFGAAFYRWIIASMATHWTLR